MTEEHILSSLQRLEAALKELQIVVTDLAVVKAKVGTIETDLEGIRKSLFNNTTSDGNIFDRMTRIEDKVKAMMDSRLSERLTQVENDVRNNVMTKDACKEGHEKQFSRMWRIVAPLIVAFVLALSGLFYEGVIKKPAPLDVQVDAMRKLLREELQRTVPPASLSSAPAPVAPPTTSP